MATEQPVVDTDQPPKLVGDAHETQTCNDLDALEPVDDQDADWHDAQLVAPLTAADDLRLFGQAAIPAGRPVEIKSCQQWISDGADGRRRGRWYIKRNAHQQLVDHHGVYLFVVYHGDTGQVLSRIAAPSYKIGTRTREWSDVSGEWGDAEVSKLTWTALLDPELLAGREGR